MASICDTEICAGQSVGGGEVPVDGGDCKVCACMYGVAIPVLHGDVGAGGCDSQAVEGGSGVLHKLPLGVE